MPDVGLRPAPTACFRGKSGVASLFSDGFWVCLCWSSYCLISHCRTLAATDFDLTACRPGSGQIPVLFNCFCEVGVLKYSAGNSSRSRPTHSSAPSRAAVNSLRLAGVRP